jgi:GNAT superfamily N-acetyltransferase
MREVSIRTASKIDIPIIQEIAYTTWPSTYGHILSKEQLNYMLDMMYSSSSLENQMNQNITFFLAELNGEIVGFASTGREPMEGMFKLHKLYILPNIQTKGIGSALLEAVILFAKKNSGEQLVLQVNRNNSAVDFYKKKDFIILYEADFDIGNGYQMNDYVMGKII